MNCSRSRHRLWASLFAVLLLGTLVVAATGPVFAASGPDYAIPNGWFFTQTGGGNGNGYTVRNTGTDANGHTIRFWGEFQRLGGVPTLGYPIGEPYVGSDGFTYQPFQRGVLQWRPELNLAYLSNTFEILSNADKDSWLLSVKGVPMPITNDGSNGNYAKAVSIRLGWLTNPQIKSQFLANPNPSAIANWNQNAAIQLYGLPMSKPEQHGPFISQRFQRISFQLWTASVPGMPAPGTVVGILGGSLLNEAGLLPAGSTRPLGPNASAPVGVTPTPQSTATPAPQATATPSSQPTATPAPQATATPAQVASGNYPWYVSNVTNLPNCGTSYVYGYTRNASGGTVDGIEVKSWNAYGNAHISTSSTSYNGQDGYYDRIFQAPPQPGTWYVQVVDGAGNPASAVQAIDITANCNPNNGAAVQEVEVDFQSH
jgi:hypothetical protein